MAVPKEAYGTRGFGQPRGGMGACSLCPQELPGVVVGVSISSPVRVALSPPHLNPGKF